MDTNVYVGLAVNNHADGLLCAAAFDDVIAPPWRPSIQGTVRAGEIHVRAPAAQAQACVLEASNNWVNWQALGSNTAVNGNGGDAHRCPGPPAPAAPLPGEVSLVVPVTNPVTYHEPARL